MVQDMPVFATELGILAPLGRTVSTIYCFF